MEKEKTPPRITEEAARDIWAAELKNGTECFHRWGSVTWHLLDVLKQLHESTGGHVNDPLGFFLSEPGDEHLSERKKVEGIHPRQESQLRRETIVCCLIYCLLARDTAEISLSEVVLSKFLKLLLIERLEEREMNGPVLDAGNDDFCGLVGGKGI